MQTCKFCRRDHYKGECTANGKTCLKFKKSGNFARVHHTKEKNRDKSQNTKRTKTSRHSSNMHKNRNVDTATYNDNKDECANGSVHFYSIAAEHQKRHIIPLGATEAYAKLRIGNKTAQIKIKSKIDRGAIRNLLSLSIFRQMKDIPLKKH